MLFVYVYNFECVYVLQNVLTREQEQDSQLKFLNCVLWDVASLYLLGEFIGTFWKLYTTIQDELSFWTKHYLKYFIYNEISMPETVSNNFPSSNSSENFYAKSGYNFKIFKTIHFVDKFITCTFYVIIFRMYLIL